MFSPAQLGEVVVSRSQAKSSQFDNSPMDDWTNKLKKAIQNENKKDCPTGLQQKEDRLRYVSNSLRGEILKECHDSKLDTLAL